LTDFQAEYHFVNDLVSKLILHLNFVYIENFILFRF